MAKYPCICPNCGKQNTANDIKTTICLHCGLPFYLDSLSTTERKIHIISCYSRDYYGPNMFFDSKNLGVIGHSDTKEITTDSRMHLISLGDTTYSIEEGNMDVYILVYSDNKNIMLTFFKSYALLEEERKKQLELREQEDNDFKTKSDNDEQKFNIKKAEYERKFDFWHIVRLSVMVSLLIAIFICIVTFSIFVLFKVRNAARVSGLMYTFLAFGGISAVLGFLLYSVNNRYDHYKRMSNTPYTPWSRPFKSGIVLDNKSMTEKIGEQGESVVSAELRYSLGSDYYLNNLIIQEKIGESTSQIDHIAINKYGIWVIETKNYSGMIFGETSNQEWTQCLNYGQINNKFYNPIKQNEKHIKRLQEYIGCVVPIHSVIIFISADISKLNVEDSNADVITIGELRYTINSGQQVFTDKEVVVYYEFLKRMQFENSILEKQHKKNVIEKKNNIENGLCPCCGGKLIIKNGKNGQFYGCEKYPYCKFTKNI